MIKKKLCNQCRTHLALFSPSLLKEATCLHTDKKQINTEALTEAMSKKLKREMFKAMKSR